MKKSLLFLSTLFMLPIIMPQTAEAQQTQKRHKVQIVKYGKLSSIDSTGEDGIISRLKIKEDRHFNAPDAPGTAIINNKGNFGITIGGAARVVLSEDFGGVVNTTNHYGFQVPQIPTSLDGMSHSQFRLNAGTSTLFIKSISRSRVLGDVTTYISMNFLGNNYSPELRQAYIKVKGFTLGQAWSTATDLDAIPPTIDYWGPSGGVIMRTQLIRYENKICKNMSFGIAAEMPSVGGTYKDSYNHSITQSVPDFIGYLQYSWGKGHNSHIRATGIFRDMAYYNDIDKNSKMEMGWGAQISGLATFCPWATMYFSGTVGKGIARYINDMGGLNYDLMPDVNAPGDMRMTSMYGMFIGMQFNLTKDVFVSGTYSQSMIFDTKNVDLSGTDYRYSQYIVGNIFWNVTDYMIMGLEYQRGINNEFNKDQGHANRISLSAKYSF
ncbi:MAG: hypothetical protein RRZ64_05275 [Rikenellaceae bacterium]